MKKKKEPTASHIVSMRMGVGTVIFAADSNEVAVFRRDGTSIWQLQQGGLDCQETRDRGRLVKRTPEIPLAGMKRELQEETGLRPIDYHIIGQYPALTCYTFETTKSRDLGKAGKEYYQGQIHQWWYLRLKPTVVIDLSEAPDKEFDVVEFLPIDHALARMPGFKAENNRILLQYAERELLSKGDQ